jgi:PTH1 family peptidyl-tRNA hydrolase
MAWVITGLGNPGKRYEKTRHNFGELVLREMARKRGLILKEEKRFQSLVARGELEGKPLYLVVPTTYMNESGQAVKALLDFYKLPVESLAVVCDDIALDFGTMRLKGEGSSGGHNGLKSIQQQLATSCYVRLRMGIGRGSPEEGLAEYVLDPFTGEELEALPALLEKAGAALEDWMRIPLARVMERVNTKVKQLSVGETKHEST